MSRVSKDATSLVVRPWMMGALAFGALITIYFGVLTLLSGWDFTVSQFSDYWYYLVPLAAGFGAHRLDSIPIQTTGAPA